jgi:putative flippase GtrA
MGQRPRGLEHGVLEKNFKELQQMIPGAERLQERDEADDAAKQRSPAQNIPLRYRAYYQFWYARLDQVTKGRAAEIVRFGSFLFFGGLAALVNLACVWLFSRYTTLPYDVYIVLATEISLLCNFIMNDRATFGTLGRQRPWLLRCLRFHGPASIGFVLTLVLAYVAHHFGHLAPVSAQAVAIIIVTLVNFAMHRLWTYRSPHAGQKPSADAALL